MKKYIYLSIIMLSFFLLTNVVNASYYFTGDYTCYKGVTTLSKVSNWNVSPGGELQYRCPSGYTNVNFEFAIVESGAGATNGDTLAFSFVPSAPLGIEYGIDTYDTSSRCMIGESLGVCSATMHNGVFGFALFGDGGYYWHILDKFKIASETEIASLSNYQSQYKITSATGSAINSSTNSINSNTNNAINNSTNSINSNTNSAIKDSTTSINSNANSNKNEIIDNQNSQFNTIQQQNEQIQAQNEEQHETSKGIWGTIKSIFSEIVGFPGKILSYLKSIFLPNQECHQSRNLFDKSNVEIIDGYIQSSYEFVKGTWHKTLVIPIKPKTTYTISKRLSVDFKIGTYKDKITNDNINKQILSSYASTSSSPYLQFTGNSYANYLYIGYYSINDTISEQDILDSIMVVEGSDVIDYEPYGVDICTGGSFGDWFSSVVSGIGTFFSNLTSAIGGFFTNLTNAIGEFFNNLLTGILEGLKSLFVPTDSQLYEIINESKELAENFGFVGESINFFINIFTSLLGLVNANGCVELPEFSIGATSLFDKITFWNSQYVCLSDNVVLSTHIDTIRTVTSIVLVCLFVGFASSKFFNILNKNDNNQASMDSYDLRDRS